MNSAQWPLWAKNAVLYEVNVRQFTPEGTLKAFITHLPRLKALGVDILWFMPIFPISVAKRKGSLGSYYAVSDYTDVNPEIGTLKDFKQVVEKAHELGLKVILDWVPNHTGWDHPWITQHPEFYTKDANGNITDPIDGSGKSMGWLDVADLNYSNQQMREFMITAMLFWVNNLHIDGFRQDMALLVPIDFWQQSSKRLRE
ncbi:MAG: alpha-amylase family glycosyl hydrolase [Saprospiraceae bacterium]